MKYSAVILLTYLACLPVNADPPIFAPEPVVLDFSNSHSVKTFTESGIQFTDISNSSIQSFSCQYQKLIIKLPKGRIFKQNVGLGIADAKEGMLKTFRTQGVVTTHEEAYEVARLVHLNLGLPTKELEQWYESEKDKGRSAKSYSKSNTAIYPAVSIAIKDSINKKYPWYILLQLTWDLKKHRDWDEERATRENPPPPAQYASLSLEPPSGNVYDRSEAYAEAGAYAEKTKSQQGEQPPAATNLPKPQPEAATPTAEAEQKPNSFAWLWIGAIVVVASVVAFLVIQRQRA